MDKRKLWKFTILNELDNAEPQFDQLNISQVATFFDYYPTWCLPLHCMWNSWHSTHFLALLKNELKMHFIEPTDVMQYIMFGIRGIVLIKRTISTLSGTFILPIVICPLNIFAFYHVPPFAIAIYPSVLQKFRSFHWLLNYIIVHVTTIEVVFLLSIHELIERW